MSSGSDQQPVGPGPLPPISGSALSAPPSASAVRWAGVVVYVYSGLLAAAAVALLVGAVGAYQAGTEPCPPGGGPCES
jgi:hypothetical protein